MKIGYFINFQWYPPKHGNDVHAFQVASQLSKRGHTLNTIFYDYPAPGLNINLFRRRNLPRFIKNTDILYIRTDGSFGSEKLTLLKILKLFSIPVVWEINSPLDELLKWGKSPEEVKHLTFLRTLYAKFANAAICVSREMQEYAIKVLKIKNSHFVPNGSDKELFHPDKKNESLYRNYSDNFKVIYAGSSLNKWQALDVIFEVAKKIYTLDKKIIFILITDEKYINIPENNRKNIIILGRKDYLELPPFLASADAGLCLYHNYGWNSKFYFSPLKLFDYMASGLPVIATGVGQINDVIKNNVNGILVNNDMDQISEKILFLKNNYDCAKMIGQKARHSIENYYNWERVGCETERIFKDAIDG